MFPILSALKFIAVDVFLDIFYFPIWWYTKGIKKTAFFCVDKIRELEYGLALKIWVVNIFKPMYAQYDIEGRIVSFIMRVFQIILRAAAYAAGVIFILFLFIIWIIAPVFVVSQIIFTISLMML